MSFTDLQDFVQKLEKQGELKRIKTEVSAELEITGVYKRVFDQGGPALLFENVKGHSTPVLINLFGTKKRMAYGLGVDNLDLLTNTLGALIKLAKEPPINFLDRIKTLPKLMEAASFMPKTIKSGICKEVIIKDDIDLNKIPIIKCWPKDAERYITYPLVFTKDPVTGKRNCGTYRMQVIDKDKAIMHFHPHKDAARHYQLLNNQPPTTNNQRLDVSVAIGSDPATLFSSVLPLPPDLDEMLIAGVIKKEGAKMIKCETNDLEVPANSELVLEGYLEVGDTMIEGPFGDHTGYYSVPEPFPIFHIKCITMRKHPIYHTIVVGIPNQEDAVIGYGIERLFLPLMQFTLPEIVDYHMPPEGMFNDLMLIKIKKQYPGHARKVMHSIWGLGQAMLTKCLIVFDENVNLQDYREVVWKALISIDPKRDIEFVNGPLDILDHATEHWCYGSKMGIDATKKWKEEGFRRVWPDQIEMSPEINKLIDGKWEELRRQIF